MPYVGGSKRDTQGEIAATKGDGPIDQKDVIDEYNFDINMHVIYGMFVEKFRQAKTKYIELEFEDNIPTGMPVNLKYRDNVLRCKRTEDECKISEFGDSWLVPVQYINTEKIKQPKYKITPDILDMMQRGTDLDKVKEEAAIQAQLDEQNSKIKGE